MSSKIKILCTLGPSSFQSSTIKKLDNLGVDIFRINLSHTSFGEIEKHLIHILSSTRKPVCLDLEGAQIRSGLMKENKVYFKEGNSVKIHSKPVLGDHENINLTPSFVINELKPGDLISIDFDTLLLKVCARGEDCLISEVVCGGTVGSNKAVSTDREIHLPSLSPKDIEAVKIGLRHNVPYIALSFASNKEDIDKLNQLTNEKMKIISKIESKKGLMHMEELILNSDAILIDRGDLSRELSIEVIPFVQKKIISLANKLEKPVYVATNFLETMIEHRLPTRAEINDMINTIIDGADGLVLAAETAIGLHPSVCVSMVQRVLKVCQDFKRTGDLEQMASYNSHTLVTVAPHGNKQLINRVKFQNYEEKWLNSLKKVWVDADTLFDCEQIAIGSYSPLEGFMTRAMIDSVLEHCRLPTGEVWTLPIVLQVLENVAKDLTLGSTVALCSKDDGCIYALFYLEEIYDFDAKRITKRWYETDDISHPGVTALKAKGSVFLGGKIDLIRRIKTKFDSYTLTPLQTRHIFENRGWNSIGGFHINSIINRRAEYIQMKALHNYNLDGLFLHSVAGNESDRLFSPDIVLKTYSLMSNHFYPKDKVFLAAFLSYPRFAGPREMVFEAICQKNFGCTHFIMDNSNQTAENFYQPEAVRYLFQQVGDIGVEPIFFDDVYSCSQCEQNLESCVHGKSSAAYLSETEIQNMFLEGAQPPKWFMRPEIAEVVYRELHFNKALKINAMQSSVT